ncbi:MAG: hypothetical protein E6Q40_01960 [Cupriavidus sp.]|nr:MAG: hypothetical protein E6Q40_01960 [Cupriavidus sp.]
MKYSAPTSSPRVVLEIRGPVTQGEIAAATNRLMKEVAAPRQVSHLLKTIFVEMAQNVLKHSKNAIAIPAIISITDAGECFTVQSRNAAAPATAEKVAEILSDTAQLSRTGLIRVRRSELHKPRPRGCAGIGLIEIQRKTATPVICTITPLSVSESIVEIVATLRK